jgi:hypothetical protein
MYFILDNKTGLIGIDCENNGADVSIVAFNG